MLGGRPDGFHEVRTVLQAVDLFDTVTFLSDELGVPRLTVSALPGVEAGLPLARGADNLALRALTLVEEEIGCRLPLRIHLRKRIPVGAGLGGGSSDAAAVLWGVWRLAHLGWDCRRLARLAARLGADVPFFLRGGTALGEGRGDVVRPLRFLGRWPVVLVRPPLAIPTAAVYQALAPSPTPPARGREALLRAVRRRNKEAVAAVVGNALEEAAFSLFPQLRHVKAELASLGALAVGLSGSGPTFFLLARTMVEARRLARSATGPGWFVRVSRFYHKGVGGEDPAAGRRRAPRR